MGSFPTVFKKIEDINAESKSGVHKLTTKPESQIMVCDLIHYINREKIHAIIIHDGVLVDSVDADRVRNFIANRCLNVVGFRPHVKVNAI